MTISTRKIWDVLLANEEFLTEIENVYAKRLIKWTSNGSAPFIYANYLKYVQSLRLVKQKQEVTFLVRIFKEAGIRLGHFEIRHFQTVTSSEGSGRQLKTSKACLARDEEIQEMVKILSK